MSREVETAVVGLAATAPKYIPQILSKITPADIWDPKTQAVLTAAAGLWAEGVHVDAVGIVGRLTGSQVDAGDVFNLIEQACPPASLPNHLKTLADAAATRRLSAAGQRIHQLAESGETPEYTLQHAQELLDNAIRTNGEDARPVAETMPDTLEKIRAAQRGEKEIGLPTGLIDLDKMLDGLAGGQMIIIAARPGVGKSTLGVDFMRHASLELGVPSLMFSLEMSTDEVNQRVLAAEAEIPLKDIVAGTLTDEHWQKVEKIMPRVEAGKMFVDDSTETTISDIAAKSRLLVDNHGVGLIVVDYLQLMRAEGAQSREQEVASYSRAMKMLAKQCDVPVVVIAQLNRESERRGGQPMLSDLRESGALEQDADVVLLIDRPEAKDPMSPRMGEADVIVAKNRRGRTGTVTVAAQMSRSRFSNLARGFQ